MNKFKHIESSAHDEQWQRAVAVFHLGDKAGALFLFKKLARNGCAAALVEIGNIYEQGGGGVDLNVDEAIKWYQTSIDILDDPKAHLGLGRIVLLNAQSESDYKKAFYHFSLLAEENQMGALYALGYLYEFGLGVEKNLEEARAYYCKAIELGHILAQRNLSRIIMKENFLNGVCLWVKTFYRILQIGLTNSNDKRLSIK